MPINDLFQGRRARPPVAGRIRLGVYEGRPKQADTLVFTAPDKATLLPLEAQHGGELEPYTPQNSTQEEWRLVSETDAIDCWFPFRSAEDNYSMDYEMWGRSGLHRRCDGVTAQTFSVDERTGEITTLEVNCICKAQDEMECDTVTRLRFILPETPGIGVWELSTKSKFALFELHDILEFLGEHFDGQMNRLPLRLAYIPKQIGYYDEKKGRRSKTTKRVPTINLQMPFGQIAQRLGVELTPGMPAAYELEAPSELPAQTTEGVASTEPQVDMPAPPAEEPTPSADEVVEGETVEEEPVTEEEAVATVEEELGGEEVGAPLSDEEFERELQRVTPGDMSLAQVKNVALRMANRKLGATKLTEIPPLERQGLVDDLRAFLFPAGS